VLGNAGIALTETREGRDVRLAGTTRSGKKFALVLKQQYAGGGPRTSVGVVWEDGPDEEFWGIVTELLISRKASKNTAGTNTGASPTPVASSNP
jgi:hypothetical protein